MLTFDEVVWGYRYILGREPESDEIIRTTALAMSDYRQFRGELLRSSEFERVNTSFKNSRWVIAPVFDAQRLLWLDLSDVYVSLGCLQDNYEAIESGFVRANLKSGDVFVDIGANIGWFSLLASTVIGEAGQVHSFEPRGSLAGRLKQTVMLNNLSNIVSVYPVGLSDENKDELLMWEEGSDNAGSASFAMNDRSEHMMKEKIKVVRLDDIGLQRVDFIKIDVEGAELLAMRGGNSTIGRHRPLILSEVLPSQLARVSGVQSDEYFEFFQALNYRAFIIDERDLGREISGFPGGWYKEIINVAFVPNERSDVVFNWRR